MAVAHLDTIESSTWTTTPDPFTFDYAPGSTINGLVVSIAHNTGSGDQITGVTADGTAMTRVVTIADTAGEPGRVYLYFLGASIPSGTLTISIDHSASTDVKIANAAGITATTDTEVIDSDSTNVGTDNPSLTLSAGSKTGIAYGVAHSGLNTPANLAAGTGVTVLSDHDYGNQITRFARQTTPATGDFTFGWTSIGDDLAFAAMMISEVAAASTADPFPYVAGGYYPTEG